MTPLMPVMLASTAWLVAACVLHVCLGVTLDYAILLLGSIVTSVIMLIPPAKGGRGTSHAKPRR